MQKTGRIIAGLFACALALWAVQASAATESISRSFNHMTTGFPLSGGHATAACETCHVGGVFKGTPRACDGCHAMGKRVIATPKPNSHIVTDAPCESCHFFAHTWLGARYNHGSAAPGQCRNCHAGRLATGKPNSHNVGKKATESCDSCHRSFAWTPASWNHNGTVPGSCATAGCHVSGSNQYFMPNSHNTAIQYTTRTKASFGIACDSCHNYTYWYQAPFKHNVAGACDGCHTKKPGHIAIALNADCSACHRTRSNGWLPASVHTGNEAGICRTCHATTPQPSSHTAAEYVSLSCDACHKSQTTWTGASGHIDLVPPHVPTCRSCHNNRQHDGDHGANSSMDCSTSGCHRPGGTKGSLFSKWD